MPHARQSQPERGEPGLARQCRFFDVFAPDVGGAVMHLRFVGTRCVARQGPRPMEVARPGAASLYSWYENSRIYTGRTVRTGGSLSSEDDEISEPGL